MNIAMGAYNLSASSHAFLNSVLAYLCFSSRSGFRDEVILGPGGTYIPCLINPRDP